MAYSRQGRAILGRRHYNPVGISSRPPYYPKREVEAEEVIPERQYPYSEQYQNDYRGVPNLDSGYYGGMNKDDMIAAQEEGYYENIERQKRGEEPLTEREIHQRYIDKFRIPDDTLSGLRRERSANLPGGDMDISAGLPEGFSDPSGMPGGASLNASGIAAQKGHYGEAIAEGAKGIFGLMSAPITAPLSIAKPVTDFAKTQAMKGWNALKGAFGSNAPNLGSAVPSGTGISGLSGPMGLAHADQQGMVDLAALDIGDFGGGDVGPGGEGGGDPGAMGLGMGLGGDDSIGEW